MKSWNKNKIMPKKDCSIHIIKVKVEHNKSVIFMIKKKKKKKKIPNINEYLTKFKVKTF
jgi:hypothetical protein